ncbi:phosphoribosylglycinamide formyltransferase [Candidatus Dependentiae bacterium]|nr:phosphoribosylglycinamide formyltransferase [Candidatus Dependentiae bacterium]
MIKKFIILTSIINATFCMEHEIIEPIIPIDEPLHIAILVSGNGSNMEAILSCFERFEKRGLIKPCVVISNKKDAYALKRAQKEVETKFKNPVPTEYLPIKAAVTEEEKENARREYAHKLIACLSKYDVTPENGLICAAGFMLILHKDFINHFPNKIINIHPSLLPAFPGADAIKKAFLSGVKITGVTVHFIDEGMDTGLIIKQKSVDIDNYDTEKTLEEKIHKVEHELFPKVIEQYATDKIAIAHDKVRNRLVVYIID